MGRHIERMGNVKADAQNGGGAREARKTEIATHRNPTNKMTTSW